MKIIKLLLKFTFSFAVFLSFSVNVSAAEDSIQSYKKCINGVLYQINWDKNRNNLVNESLVNESNISTGYVRDVTGLSEQEKIKYKFSASVSSIRCSEDNGKIKTCPSNGDLIKYNTSLLTTVSEDKTKFKYIDFDFNINTGKFDLRVKNVFDSKVKIRIVYDKANLNSDGKTMYQYNDFLYRNSNYYTMNGLNPSYYDGTKVIENKIYLEVYIDDTSSKCNGEYLLVLELVVPTVNDVELDNPALTDKSYGCDDVKKYINKLISSGVVINDNDVISGLKNNYASFCYNSKISYLEYQNLRNNINQQFNDLKTLMGYGSDDAITTFSANGDSTCNEGYSQGKRLIASTGGRFWSVNCFEEYSARGDSAKLVYAGAGFVYGAEFHAKRTCNIVWHQQVVKKPLCVYSCSMQCSYYNSSSHSASSVITCNNPPCSNGPNEDFDNCIKTCDGGKYSQSCINTCYTNVYGNDRKLSINNKTLSLNESNNGIKRLALDEDGLGTITIQAEDFYNLDNVREIGPTIQRNWGTKHSYVGTVATKCGDMDVYFSNWCADSSLGNATCVISVTKGPSGCVDDPWGLYSKELSQSYSEFTSAMNLAISKMNTGSYDIKISDSYLNSNGKAYVYSLSSDSGQKIIKSDVDNLECQGQSATAKLGDSTNEAVSYCAGGIVSTKDVTIGLVDSYLNKNSGYAAYDLGNGFGFFNTKNDTPALERFNFTPNEFYNAGNRYYTNLMSKNVNVDVSNPNNIVLKQEPGKAVIDISAKNFGTNGNFSTEIDCFYGVYNDTFVRKGIPEISDGLQFIFRPIELKDVFPNDRNPRWNWTNDATPGSTNVYNLLNYKISPVELTEQIQEKDKNIYSDNGEVDYEFTLDPQTIKKIRSYNKKEKSYGKDITYVDYDMNCTTYNGRSYCYSEFLDNYLKLDNMTNTERHNIAVCNNTYSGKCSN